MAATNDPSLSGSWGANEETVGFIHLRDGLSVETTEREAEEGGRTLRGAFRVERSKYTQVMITARSRPPS